MLFYNKIVLVGCGEKKIGRGDSLDYIHLSS
jgi:hypothetical protein